MAIAQAAAQWFLPFVLPICLYVCFTDMARMRITNVAVIALFGVFAVVGAAVLPFDVYLWRFVQVAAVLVAGIALNAGGAIGAGDAKFAAAAAAYINLGDTRFIVVLFAATLLAAFVTHRLARASAIRRLVPDWRSWSSGARFPMGLALAGTLGAYLILGALYGV